MAEFILHPSPNFDTRATPIDMLVLHYTGMTSGAASLARLCDPDAKVSAHYLIDLEGQIYQLVAEENRAWHAGAGYWLYPPPFPLAVGTLPAHQDLNSRSIGIEVVNLGHEHGYHPFPAAQIAAVIELCQAILRRHPGIPSRNVVGHSDIAPKRKQDPGELFPWRELAEYGIGLYPRLAPAPHVEMAADALYKPLYHPGDVAPAIAALQERLADYGYGLRRSGVYDFDLYAVVVAWQRHFRPRLCDGRWDAECDALLTELTELSRVQLV